MGFKMTTLMNHPDVLRLIDIEMKTFEVTHLIYSVSDNVTRSHYILHNRQQVAVEQLVQPRLGITQFRQRLDGLKTKRAI